ncbi:MAG: ATP-binding cassette domain-containing protein [Bacteroidia bacterium]|nr:ATP-binding cassette domain-containing protein [Bacteroidia bacterium]
MSDSILRALMQLFAIVANTDEVGLKGREIVERFLRRQLASSFVAHYLSIYDDFLNKLKGNTEEGKVRKRTSVNSVKVLRICTEINKELEQKQKIIVLIRLFEFIHTATGSIVEQHREFLDSVAETFGIDKRDTGNISSLVKGLEESSIDSGDHFLVIDRNVPQNFPYRHLQREGIGGKLIFLTIADPFLIVFTYTGTDTVVMDSREITPNAVQVFEPGSLIKSPKFSPVYYNDVIHNISGDGDELKLIFNIENLGYSFKKGKIGLHDLNFTTSSKNLVGIMGNSGAGKTTLLNLLNGSVKPSKGKILINGQEIYSNKKQLRGLIGNIPQDDLLIEELSVFQNLFYSSKLFFGGLTDEEITAKVNICLESLKLLEIKDLLVGDPLNKYISGGQRKRLNIALELIREPDILFVDEPTSGLSSNDAENVMDLLKQLTSTGKLIFVVIHQPSSEIFKLFDQLLILDTGGYPVYFGNPVDSLSYFRKQMSFVDFEYSECPECGNINPEEIFRIMESKTVDEFGRATTQRKINSADWYRLYNENFVKAKTNNSLAGEAKRQNVIVSNPLIQFLVYFQRNFFSKVNNKQYMAITLIEGPLLAFILALALRSHEVGKEYLFGSNPNIPVYMFICTIVSLFLGLITSAEEIIQDKKILKRESFLQLSRNSYLLSKILFLFFVSAVQSILYVITGNTILEFPGLFSQYFFVLFSVSCFGNLLGLNISSGMKTRVAVYILIPFLVIPQIMLSGVMVKFEDLNPVVGNQSGSPLIGNIMATRWAYEGLAVVQYKNNDFGKEYFEIEKRANNAYYRKSFWVQQMDIQINHAEELLKKNNPDPDSLEALNSFFLTEMNTLRREFPEIRPAIVGQNSFLTDKAKYLLALKVSIDSTKKYFIREYNSANEDKDRMTTLLSAKLGSSEKFMAFKRKNHSEKLEDFVLNLNEVDNQVIIADNKIVRRFKPVFASTYEKSFFSAPFYSHSKSWFGSEMATYTYNMIIIWIMTILLYFTLYKDVLRRLFEK